GSKADVVTSWTGTTAAAAGAGASNAVGLRKCFQAFQLAVALGSRSSPGVLFAFSLTLLMVVGAAAANEDLRLVDAAKNQDAQQVRALLNGHPAVNVRSEDGST